MQRVLLIDDDLGTLETFQVILRLAGFDVCTAASGIEALQMVRTSVCDLVLCDYRLPDMTGLDILRSLSLEGIKTPFVIMTGYASVSSAVDALKLGATDYVEKPISDTRLVEIARSASQAGAATELEDRQAEDAHAHDWRVRDTLRIIDERYADTSLRVRAVAKELNTSTEHLCRLLKRDTGAGFRSHLHRRRVLEGKRLLAHSHLSVKEIAAAIGYPTTSRFDHYFSKTFGMTPMAFRRTVERSH